MSSWLLWTFLQDGWSKKKAFNVLIWAEASLVGRLEM